MKWIANACKFIANTTKGAEPRDLRVLFLGHGVTFEGP